MERSASKRGRRERRVPTRERRVLGVVVQELLVEINYTSSASSFARNRHPSAEWFLDLFHVSSHPHIEVEIGRLKHRVQDGRVEVGRGGVQEGHELRRGTAARWQWEGCGADRVRRR